jgi:hypothetical protein
MDTYTYPTSRIDRSTVLAAILGHDADCFLQAECGAEENMADAGYEISPVDRVTIAATYIMDGSSTCYCRTEANGWGGGRPFRSYAETAHQATR